MSGGTIFPSEYCPGGHVKGGTSHTVTPEMVGFGNVECGIEADYDSHVGLVFCMHSLASALCMHIHLGTSANYMHTRNIKC